MVVFTCNYCGDSLQKPRVEKHYNIQCRKPKSLTCVDCFKDFKNEEYVVHTKCFTEEERYSAKGSIPGGVVKKGEVKQESWVEMIRSIVDNEKNLPPSLKKLFETISSFSNIPRKKVKFINFLKSSSGGRVNFNDIEAAWNLIEKYKSQQSKEGLSEKKSEENGLKHKLNGSEEIPIKKKKKSIENSSNGNSKEINEEEKQNSDTTVVKKKKKANKNSSDNQDNNTSEHNTSSAIEKIPTDSNSDIMKFSFKETILNVLKTKGSISTKKLQKKVLSFYVKETGNDYNENTIKKYNKKLKKLPNVVISDDIVSFTTSES